MRASKHNRPPWGCGRAREVQAGQWVPSCAFLQVPAIFSGPTLSSVKCSHHTPPTLAAPCRTDSRSPAGSWEHAEQASAERGAPTSPCDTECHLLPVTSRQLPLALSLVGPAADCPRMQKACLPLQGLRKGINAHQISNPHLAEAVGREAFASGKKTGVPFDGSPPRLSCRWGP